MTSPSPKNDQKSYSVAPHLSEFQKIISSDSTPASLNADGSNNNMIDISSSTVLNDSNKLLNRKPSFTSSSIDSNISLTPSTIADLQHTLISSNDRKEFDAMLQSLLRASQDYSKALSTVSKAASEFGFAMESLAKSKGSQDHSDMLLACSGLHLLISNHHQVLSWTISENFSKKFETVIDKFQYKCKDNDALLNRELKDRIKTLKVLEKDNYRISKSKKRNLITYKETLQKINNQIDSIDTLKFNYYDSLAKLISDTNSKIVKYGQVVSKAEFEIYENIARKGWTEGSSNDLVSNCSDPFDLDAEETSNEEENGYRQPTNDMQVNYLEQESEDPVDDLHSMGDISMFKRHDNDVIFHTKIDESNKSKTRNFRNNKIRSPFLHQINTKTSSLLLPSDMYNSKSPKTPSFNSNKVLESPFIASPKSVYSHGTPKSPAAVSSSLGFNALSTSSPDKDTRNELIKNVSSVSNDTIEGLRTNLAKDMKFEHSDSSAEDASVNENNEADETITSQNSRNDTDNNADMGTDDDDNSLSLPNAVTYSPA